MLQSIWKGGMTATFDQLWENISATSIDEAVAAAQGKSVPPRIVTPSFTIDQAAMQQIAAGTYQADPKALTFLKAQVQRAQNGCPPV
jgi:ABC-type sugar transport system substrate-binding protein